MAFRHLWEHDLAKTSSRELEDNLALFKVICYCLRRVVIEHCLPDCLQNKTLYVYYDACNLPWSWENFEITRL